MTRPPGSAESTMNSATSSAADPATTNTFQPPADAVTSSITLASRSASCRPHDQNNSRRAHSGANGARRDRTLLIERLKKLERMELARLAHEEEPAHWSLSDRMEQTLRALGERGDAASRTAPESTSSMTVRPIGRSSAASSARGWRATPNSVNAINALCDTRQRIPAMPRIRWVKV